MDMEGIVGIPPHLALLFGALIGVVGYGPVKRWMVTLRRELAHDDDHLDTPGKDSRALLMIFATMHPAPWVLIVVVPLLLYQLTLGPLPMMWLRLVFGMVLGMALVELYERQFARCRRLLRKQM